MARNAFFSFHYAADNWRASQVRNMGVIEGNQAARDNDWETIVRGGDRAIEKWIDSQMFGKSCVVVLVGSGTAGRKWIDYEIQQGWNANKGVLGVRIHGLADSSGDTARAGRNPFAGFTLEGSGASLESIIPVYDPTHWDTKQTYANIKANLADWLEEAIAVRGRH